MFTIGISVAWVGGGWLPSTLGSTTIRVVCGHKLDDPTLDTFGPFVKATPYGIRRREIDR